MFIFSKPNQTPYTTLSSTSTPLLPTSTPNTTLGYYLLLSTARTTIESEVSNSRIRRCDHLRGAVDSVLIQWIAAGPGTAERHA